MVYMAPAAAMVVQVCMAPATMVCVAKAAFMPGISVVSPVMVVLLAYMLPVTALAFTALVAPMASMATVPMVFMVLGQAGVVIFKDQYTARVPSTPLIES